MTRFDIILDAIIIFGLIKFLKVINSNKKGPNNYEPKDKSKKRIVM